MPTCCGRCDPRMATQLRGGVARSIQQEIEPGFAGEDLPDRSEIRRTHRSTVIEPSLSYPRLEEVEDERTARGGRPGSGWSGRPDG